jgi:hypothetical protein
LLGQKHGQVRFLPYEHFSQFLSGHVDKNSTVYVYKNEIFPVITLIFNLWENPFLWIFKCIENMGSRPPKCIKSKIKKLENLECGFTEILNVTQSTA